MRQRLATLVFLFDRWLHDHNIPGLWWCDLFERIIWWGYTGERRPVEDLDALPL